MTAMDTLAAIGADAPGIPRFDDGMVNINELVRALAEALVNEIMDAQAEDACAEGNRRNGYRERRLLTSVGRITLRIPKLRRGTYFPEDLIERYSRVDRAVVAAVAEMVTSGVSTRKVEKAARALGVDRMSASQVSRICESLDAAVADLQGRPLGGARFPYLWIDATYLKCRDGGRVPGCVVVTAIGAADTGHRVLLGVDSADTEDYASWRAFLLSLRERGVAGVRCVTSDAHAGLRRAIEEVFPGAAWQRCVVHLERNVCALARSRRERALLGSVMRAVFAESDPALVRELYHLAVDEIGAVSAAAGALLEEAEADALAGADPSSPAIGALDRIIAQLDTLEANLDTAENAIGADAASIDETHAKATDSINQARAALRDSMSTYNDQLKGELTSLSDSLQKVGADTETLANSLKDTAESLGDSTDSLAADLTAAEASLRKTAETLRTAESQLAQARDDLQHALDTGDIDEVRRIIGDNPAAIAQFLAAPTHLERHAVYPMADNGSAMSPFYTSLALWIGAIFMVALMSVSVSPARQRALAAKMGGAGGLMPVQMLATPLFGDIYPWLPFAYSMPALESAMAGIYGNQYLVQMADLAAFLVPSLVLGLLLRRPVIRLNNWILRKLDETKIL